MTAGRDPSAALRRLIRRSAWLMLGAAIGLAAALLVASVLSVILGQPPIILVVVIAVLAGAGLGLVPGARELEVTAARSMLESESELVAPRRVRNAHRIQTIGWVLLHLIAGTAVAVCLFAVIPGAVLIITEAVLGRRVGSMVPVAAGSAGRTLTIVLAVLVGLAALIIIWPVGAVMAALAGRFLGPTAYDRLELAIDRANREAEHTRLARELHDGIGHALTIVSVQAAAGRRISGKDPEAAAEAFGTIEDTARNALGELDQLLAVLRDAHGADHRPVALEEIIAVHRRSGLDLKTDVDLPERLPPLLQRNVNRIVTEALTNAHRHGSAGRVQLSARYGDGKVSIEVSNPATSATRRHGGGRGLTGISERVALFGGSVDAGRVGDRWVVRAELPFDEDK
jgi:signal transduction histidine kinase